MVVQNSIDLAQNVYAFPEAAIYKTKDSKKLSLTEGTQRLNDTKTKDVLMFSSHLDGTASISEVLTEPNRLMEMLLNLYQYKEVLYESLQHIFYLDI